MDLSISLFDAVLRLSQFQSKQPSLPRILRAIDALRKEDSELRENWAEIVSFFQVFEPKKVAEILGLNSRTFSSLNLELELGWEGVGVVVVWNARKKTCRIWDLSLDALELPPESEFARLDLNANKENTLLLDSEFEAIQTAMNSRVDSSLVFGLNHAASKANNLIYPQQRFFHTTLSELHLPDFELSQISPIKSHAALEKQANQANDQRFIIPPVPLDDYNDNEKLFDWNENRATNSPRDLVLNHENSSVDSEEYYEILQRSFTAWLLFTRRSRHERNYIVTNWVLAVQVWKLNALTCCFQKWVVKLNHLNLIRKAKAFKTLYEHAVIPIAEAKHHDNKRILKGTFQKWFKKAYRLRSIKRKQELREDLAIVIYESNLISRYLKVRVVSFILFLLNFVG
ncbi:UNVERIFIED_CONTAM: hypothetical protein HDU68_004222 [Siphonaria sp. JEL0065]|nr:hypothetical protein HDU68_004222 [Siphonaria sp. JEL0065]